MRIQITRTGKSGTDQQIDLQRNGTEPVQFKAEPGSRISVSLDGTQQTGQRLPGGKHLTLKKAGNNLLIRDGEETVVEIIDYYISPGAVLEGTGWTFSGTLDQLAISQTQSGVVASTDALPAASSTGASYNAAAVLGGALLLGAAAGGGGGGSGGSAPPEPPAPVLPSNVTTVNGTVVAGPVLQGHGLSVTLYKSDGSILAGPVAVAADGTFSLQYSADYKGPALARVTDRGAGADYMDEATCGAADLDTDLRAFYVSPGAGEVILAVSVLTELAVRSLSMASGDEGASGVILGGISAAQIEAANQQLATALGLDSILAAPHLVIDTSGNARSGSDLHGQVLAAFSGLQVLHGTDRAFELVLAAALDTAGSKELALLIGGATQAGVIAEMAALSPAVRSALDAAQAIDTSTLDAAAVSGLSPAVIAALSPQQIGALPVPAIAGLSFNQIVSLHTGLLQALTSQQVEAMSTEQTEALGSGQFVQMVQANGEISMFDDAGALTGALSGGASTDDSAPTLGGLISGRLPPSAVIAVYDNGVKIGEATLNAGAWSFTGLLAGGDGEHVITVRAEVPGSGIGFAVGDPLVLRLDTTVPATPMLELTAGIVDGATSAEATQAAGVATVSAEAGSVIAVTFTNGVKSVVKNVTGTGTAQAVVLTTADLLELGDGTISVSAVATDAVGNASVPQTSSFTLDATAPATPILALGAGVNDGATSAEATQVGGVMTVSAEAGSAVAVTFTNGVKSVVKNVTGTGVAQAVVLTTAELLELGDGTISVSTVATDPAGNPSASQTSGFTLDTSAPLAPILALGTGVADGATSAEATQATGVVTVSAEAGSVVAVTFTNGVQSVVKNVTGTGVAQAVVLTTAELLTLGDGTISVSAVATDLSGNPSTAQTGGFTLDTGTPLAPILTLGTGVAGGATSAEATQATGVVTVSAEAGSAIAVTFTNGVQSVVRNVTGTGAAQAVVLTAAELLALGDGSISVSAVAADPAGNASTAQTSSFTLDTSVPSAPILALSMGVSDGASGVEATQLTGVVTVSAETGSAVAVTFTNGAQSVVKNVTGTGAAQAVVLTTAELLTLGDGTISVSAAATDPAGNPSTAQTSSFTLDATAPNTPTLALGTGISDGATSAEATQVTGAVTVSAEAGSAVAVTFTNGVQSVVKNVTGTGVAQAVVLTTAELLTLGDGVISVSAVAIDLSGNPSTAQTGGFTLDTSTPLAPVLTLGTGVAGGASSAEATQATGVVTISAEAGSAVVVTFTNGVQSVVKNVTGTGVAQAVVLTAAELLALGDGSISVSAVATDPAGNPSMAQTNSFTLDTSAPPTPVVVLGTGIADGATSAEATQATGVVTVSAEAGSVVAVTFTNGVQSVVKNVTGTGAVQAVVLTTAELLTLGDGAISVSAVATDPAGNPSTAQTGSFILDTAAPVLSSSTPADDDPVRLAASANITLVFSEAVYAGSGDIVISNGLGDVRTISITDATQVSISGSTVTINPTADLLDASNYSVMLNSGVLKDAAGSDFAGITSPAGLNFTTQTPADITAPSLTSSSPANTAGGIHPQSNIILTFNEDVKAGSGNIRITNGMVALDIDVTDSSQVTISGNTITINPSTDLQQGSIYAIAFAAGVITDLANNANPGIPLGSLSFSTASYQPVMLPLVGASQPGLTINGSAMSRTGFSVSNAGDVNGDGLDDVIVGAPLETGPGRSYVVFGSTASHAVSTSTIAAGNGGFAINGEAGTDGSGYSVSGAGDINGDGYADLIVGAPGASPSGNAYVVFGNAGTSPVDLSAIAAGTGGFAIRGGIAGSQSGYSVSGAGDVNGDGLDDLVLGAPFANGNSGQSYVVFGKTGTAVIDVTALGTGGFSINGEASSGAGASVSAAGDVNGDGLADLVVGAPSYSSGAGQSYVVFGKTGAPAAVELSSLAGTGRGFVITGSTGLSGLSVSGAGDVNGDGLADLIIAVPGSDSANGKAYVAFGHTGTAAVNLAAVAAGTGGFVIGGGSSVMGLAGMSVSSAGDINGDGLADLIVGSFGADVGGLPMAGNTYVVFGRTAGSAVNMMDVATGNGGFAVFGGASLDYSGYSVSKAGDGLDDLIVGAYQSDPNGAFDGGSAHVIFGGRTGAFLNTAVDQMGTAAMDLLDDGGASQTLVGGAGDDMLVASAASVLYGGMGNDNFSINGAVLAALAAPFASAGNLTRLASVDGGGGIDSLSLNGGGLTLNLTSIANQGDGGSRLSSIEKIDLAGSGNNTLTLAAADVLDMSGMNIFNGSNGWTGLAASVARHQLLIDGDSGDVLNASGNWTDGGTVTYAGASYQVYNSTTSAAQLLVDTEVTRNINPVQVDATPPVLVSTSPVDDGPGAPVTANIVLNFNEAVMAGSGNITIKASGDERTIQVTDTSQVSFNGSVVTINPSSFLDVMKTYSVEFGSGVIQDLAYNPYAGLLSGMLNFNTLL